MTNKELRVRRIRGYFLQATRNIIGEQGIDAVTIRGVAKLAGYNSATLYNYFDNLNHLIALALSPHMGHYVESILEGLRGDETPFELYQLDWYVYVEISFCYPKEYYYLFFKNPAMDISEVYEEYFSAHPKRFEALPKAFQNMCLAKNQYSRDFAFLKSCFPQTEDSTLRRISEMNILIYKAMLLGLTEDESGELGRSYTERFKTFFQYTTQDIQKI